MFDQNSAILVILPLTTPFADVPSVNMLVYGNRHGPCAQCDVVTLRKDSKTVGSFDFHPSKGGLLWARDDSYEVVRDNSFLYQNGELVAAVKTGWHQSFVMILARGVEVPSWGNFNLLKPNARNWKEALSQYRSVLYA